MSKPNPVTTENVTGRGPLDPDPADVLRQTYLRHFDERFQAAVVELLRLVEGLRVFERPRRAPDPDRAVKEALAACVADLRHLTGTLRGLAAEHQDDALTPAGRRLLIAAANHSGRLGTIAAELETELRDDGAGESTAPHHVS